MTRWIVHGRLLDNEGRKVADVAYAMENIKGKNIWEEAMLSFEQMCAAHPRAARIEMDSTAVGYL